MEPTYKSPASQAGAPVADVRPKKTAARQSGGVGKAIMFLWVMRF